MSNATKVTQPDRRGFLKAILSTIIGGVIGIVPFVSGLIVYLDPLRRKSSATGPLRVAALDALPPDGIPRKFQVLATRVDAWNRMPDVPVGAVYLRRTADNKVEAFNVVCPHAGCFVDFVPEKGKYHCPCHNSSFTVAGKIADPASPSPRGLDSLEVQVRDGKEIWVNFQNFQAGRAEKIPTA